MAEDLVEDLVEDPVEVHCLKMNGLVRKETAAPVVSHPYGPPHLFRHISDMHYNRNPGGWHVQLFVLVSPSYGALWGNYDGGGPSWGWS